MRETKASKAKHQLELFKLGIRDCEWPGFSELTPEEHERFEKILSRYGVSAINACGLLYGSPSGDELNSGRWGFSGTEACAGLLARTCELANIHSIEQFEYRARRLGSYGFKHVVEDVRKQHGEPNYYVSNGQGILGFMLFLSRWFNATDDQIAHLIRPSAIHKDLNATIKVPKVFFNDVCSMHWG